MHYPVELDDFLMGSCWMEQNRFIPKPNFHQPFLTFSNVFKCRVKDYNGYRKLCLHKSPKLFSALVPTRVADKRKKTAPVRKKIFGKS